MVNFFTSDTLRGESTMNGHQGYNTIPHLLRLKVQFIKQTAADRANTPIKLCSSGLDAPLLNPNRSCQPQLLNLIKPNVIATMR